MSETTTDPKPWVNVNGWRSAVQAWHPVWGLSSFAPRDSESHDSQSGVTS